jgi:hypothetical protein
VGGDAWFGSVPWVVELKKMCSIIPCKLFSKYSKPAIRVDVGQAIMW